MCVNASRLHICMSASVRVYLLKLCPDRCDLSTKRVCASPQVCVKCRRADRSVYTRRHGVTPEVAGDRDWLPATSSLSCSHWDTVPGDTLSICFTTHGHSHTHLPEGQRRYGRQPHAHAHTAAWAHTNHSSSAAESLSGLGDLAELWLTLIGSLHHAASHLDACWQVDQTAGSWLTGGEETNSSRKKNWSKMDFFSFSFFGRKEDKKGNRSAKKERKGGNRLNENKEDKWVERKRKTIITALS